MSAKDPLRGRTQILNVCRINIINHHLAESDVDNAHEYISNTEIWFHWNGDLDTPNVREDDWE
jgi:hypothetical protein